MLKETSCSKHYPEMVDDCVNGPLCIGSFSVTSKLVVMYYQFA